MNSELLQEVKYCKYLGSHFAMDGGINAVEMRSRINEIRKVFEETLNEYFDLITWN